ncbi:MAG: (d)CMP kinase [Erysipelothrix sp.]|nr:(d)CMP kinase [Erysipelothrix sp.]
MGFQIAIDGPSASGKSSIAREVAKSFNFVHINSGLMYRAIAYKAIKEQVNLLCEEKLVELIEHTTLELTPDQRVIMDQNDVSEHLKTVSIEASTVSSFPLVRERLVHLQQEMAKSLDCVMDGRDIGTVVLPQADVKIFITADVEDRAHRRTNELKKMGIDADYENILDEMIQRDNQDINRPVGPLKQAEDALLIDTTGNTFEMSAKIVIDLIKERLGR